MLPPLTLALDGAIGVLLLIGV